MVKGWQSHGERAIYESPWVNLYVAEVELPSGLCHEHHIVRINEESVGVIIINDENQVLLTWRHRFIIDRWGWELPAGRLEPQEDLLAAGIRETVEETGYRPINPRILCSMYLSVGLSDERAHVLLAHAAVHTGDPSDVDEAPLLRWHDTKDLPELIASGQVIDGFSLCGLLWFLTFGSSRPRAVRDGAQRDSQEATSRADFGESSVYG